MIKNLLVKHRFLWFLCYGFFYLNTASGQNINSSIFKERWKAHWITGPGPVLYRTPIETDETLRNYGVFNFRKAFLLDTLPSSFIIHVSADNRYKLFVNEIMVSMGPARGDLYSWNFETIDIRPYLKDGRNNVSAIVWNFAELRPEAQISYRTAFILQGNSAAAEIINTNQSWKVSRDSSYRPLVNSVPGYYVAGPGELIQMHKQHRGWMKNDFIDSNWASARQLAAGVTKEVIFDSPAWMLVPASIPQMELKKQRLSAVRKAEGVSIPSAFLSEKISLTIPAHTSATLLFDNAKLTNAYPTLIFSGGKDAGISLSYAEAMYIPDTTKWDTAKGTAPRFRIKGKGNRNEVEGKIFIGTKDSILSDGSQDQNFTPLWWRTYRYIQLKINTSGEALVIEDIYGTFTGYPFEYNAKFESSDEQLQQVLDIGWHTARLCANETYMDCPYYEQLQYIGDARIQALVSLYNSGDSRLVRNALSQMDHSRIAEGITLSRWPSYTPQQIPTFSLWYIGMLYDYYMYGSDTGFVKDKLPGTRQILSWFSRFQTKDGSLKDVHYWNFTDWLTRKGWTYGMAPAGKNGESAVLDLQLMWTYQVAAEMEMKMGIKELALQYRQKANQLKKIIQEKYWDSSKYLYADTEQKDLFSQHTNSLAILSGMISGSKANNLAKRMLLDSTLVPASIYFKYYLHQALIKSGLGNDYLNWLEIWKENIRLGLTTWAEISDVDAARSDCHAWGSSPNIELFRTVLGIDSDAPGFRKVKIQPHLGELKKASGEIPHPAGRIKVQYMLRGDQWDIEIELPQKLAGTFIWKAKKYLLKPGKNIFRL